MLPKRTSSNLLVHVLTLLYVLIPLSVNAQSPQNITLDDSDPRISYIPPSAWITTASTPLNYGGDHKLAQNQTARAELSFTGTAVYFMSPRWPYLVNTALSLDGEPAELVDLQDHGGVDNGSGSETVASAVVWSRTNLQNTQHTLTVSVGAGQPYAIVDGIIITQLSTSSSTTGTPTSLSATSSSPTTSTSSTSQSSTAAAAADTSKELSTGSIAGIAVGSILGLVALIGLVLLLLHRRQKKQRELRQSEKTSRSNLPSFYDDPVPNSAFQGGMVSGGPPRGGTMYDPAGWKSQDSPTGAAFDASTLNSSQNRGSASNIGTYYDPAGYRHSNITTHSYAAVPTSQVGSDGLSYADGPSLRGVGSNDTLGSGRGPHIPGGYISGVPTDPQTRAPNRFNPPQSAYAATLSTLSGITQKSASSGVTVPPPVPKKSTPAASTPAARLYASGLPPSRQNHSGSTQNGSSGSRSQQESSSSRYNASRNEKKGGFRTTNEEYDAPPSYQG
ncbi:hypothetical protein CVT24_007099 [Panaeolus cyanescens]|uniref:Mid2 domain-containing protein n=1 Tax=Panaeolus cyanescens TaxID=181874 RepID=A0A409YNY8_9AGAR|nr:hypothetical protein CVT24_007099 [Panaeolus cyanescens]